ncbi:MAG: sugar transferase [Spirochaetales bacterium]|nr:sugar transferase [Spirochaetales bacterium]
MVNRNRSIKDRKIINPISSVDIKVLNKKEFRLFLNIERNRADRLNNVFSLVLFETHEVYNKKQIRRIIDTLKNRIRTVDVAGWLDDHYLGVILHATDGDGAWMFAIDVAKKIYEVSPAPPFTIFTYPHSWFENGDPNGNTTSGTGEHDEENNVINISGKQAVPTGTTRCMKKAEVLKSRLANVFSRDIPLWKRLIDLLLSGTALLLLSPLFLLVAAYIKIVSPGPVFFKQERIGYQGNKFTLLKFRTMHHNIGVNVHAHHLKELINGGDRPMTKLDGKNDSRIIRGGNVLRKSCIDELPQLINVFLGEMSLVGPRPPIPYEVNEYTRWHRYRFDVLPGLTGLWQVSGKNRLSFNQMVRLDIKYGKKLSFLFDVFIMIKTIPTIMGLIFESVIDKLRRNREQHMETKETKKELSLLIAEIFSQE